ncbi:hypothetical protein D3C73_778730 [compost metagenome]
MHAPPQFQADVAFECHRVGAHLHFLVGGNARVRPAQVCGADTTAGQQRLAGQTVGLEGVEHQGNRVESGEVGVEHGNFQP